jgi:hypothetical protein
MALQPVLTGFGYERRNLFRRGLERYAAFTGTIQDLGLLLDLTNH